MSQLTSILKLLKLFIIAFLALSGTFGVVVLATDEHLWEHAPSHAHALITFVVIDAILLGLVQTRFKLGVNATLAWGSTQAIVMVTDIFTASEFGMTLHDFAYDLLSNWAWDGLLIAQFSMAFLSWRGRIQLKKLVRVPTAEP